jgi:hypothetical protein
VDTRAESFKDQVVAVPWATSLQISNPLVFPDCRIHIMQKGGARQRVCQMDVLVPSVCSNKGADKCSTVFLPSSSDFHLHHSLFLPSQVVRINFRPLVSTKSIILYYFFQACLFPILDWQWTSAQQTLQNKRPKNTAITGSRNGPCSYFTPCHATAILERTKPQAYLSDYWKVKRNGPSLNMTSDGRTR